MIIGFDAKRALQNRTGLGNYSRFVLDILAAHAPQNTYRLYTPSERKASLTDRIPASNTLVFPRSSFDKALSALWRVWGITSDLQQDKVQLFHGLSNELPLNITRAKDIKSIVTIHDLVFLSHPEFYPPVDRRIYAYKFRKACENADRIIAVSECTKRDIISYFHTPEEKIDVVYQGCDVSFRQTADEELVKAVREKYQLPAQYILYVGSIEERKNLLLLARALKHLPTPVPVIAIGKRTPYADKVDQYLKENGLESQMRMLNNIPFKELPVFYQQAATFVYPSRYEGFGIPLLEALCSGTPAIGATGSCLEEAGGPRSIYVHPDDEVALAKAIDETVFNESLRSTMIQAGKEYAKQFEETRLAQELIAVYEKTMQG